MNSYTRGIMRNIYRFLLSFLFFGFQINAFDLNNTSQNVCDTTECHLYGNLNENL